MKKLRAAARTNPGRAAGQPRELRAAARHASLAVSLFATSWGRAARAGQRAGTIDDDFYQAVQVCMWGVEAFFSPRRPDAPSMLGRGDLFRAEVHRVVDHLPIWTFFVRAAVVIEASADELAADGAERMALALREFALWLRIGRLPAWMDAGSFATGTGWA